MTKPNLLKSQHVLLLAAHVRLARAWCIPAADPAAVRRGVHVAVEALLEAADSLWPLATDSAMQASLQAVVSAASISDPGPGALRDLARAVERIRPHFAGPNFAKLEPLRNAHHHLENLASAVNASDRLRQTIVEVIRVAEDANRREVASALSAVNAAAALDVGPISHVLTQIGDAIRIDEREARERVEKLWRRRHGVRFSHCLVVDDIPHQRAQMRHSVELGSIDRPIAEFLEAASVAEANAALSALPDDAQLLLVSDLCLPLADGGGAAPEFGERIIREAQRLAAERRCRVTAVAVTSHGRLYRRLSAVLTKVDDPEATVSPDAFLPKHDHWPAELAGIVRRALSEPSVEDAQLDVLTFTGSTALLDGVPLEFEPTGFAWLDALSDPQTIAAGIERFASTPVTNATPAWMTLDQLGKSIIMAAAVKLPEDTSAFWEQVREKARDDYIGSLLNGRARRELRRRTGVIWRGRLVESDEDDSLTGPDAWRRAKYRLGVRAVRRWASVEAYRARATDLRTPLILICDRDEVYGAVLERSIKAISQASVIRATPATALMQAADSGRLDLLVLAVEDRDDFEVRRGLVAVVGTIPIIAVTRDDDPATLAALDRHVGDALPGRQSDGRSGNSWAGQAIGRARNLVVKRGDPAAEAGQVARIAYQYLQALASRRIPVPSGAQLHTIVVPRDATTAPFGFVLDGRSHRITWPTGTCRSRRDASTAHFLLRALAELGNMKVGSRLLLRLLVLDDTGKEGGELRNDYRQQLTRGISSIREAIRAPLVGSGMKQTDADMLAASVVRGDNPYELRGIIHVVDALPTEDDIGT
ncbi:MAG: hypothetical protein ACYC3F_09610 [Gemmatimonadaceae bacterium]